MPNAPETSPSPATSVARYSNLADRTVFITGGASGIGATMVTNFAAQGARVVFVDIDEARAGEVVSRAPERITFVACNVTDSEALMDAVRSAHARHGDLYALVNNAANDQRHDVRTVTPARWDDIVAVNLKHQFFASQAAFPLIRDSGGGAIVNFASVAPLRGTPRLGVYSTCKAGVAGLTRSLAREFGPEHVRVNSVVPGAILTERQLELWITPEVEANIIAQQCLKRRMVEQDIAEMVLFLASSVSGGCTGQAFQVDGGLA